MSKLPTLKDNLARLAPSIALETIWEHDEDARWDIEDPELDANDYQAWQSEVRATAIIGGNAVTKSAHLCGTWEKFGDHPSKSNPDISGYLPQMIEEALTELGQQLPQPSAVWLECAAAIAYVKGEMQRRYDEQRQTA